MVNFIDLKKKNKNKLTFSKSGDYIVFMHNLSGQFTFDITSPYVNLDIYGLYIGQGAEQFEMNTIQRHVAPSSTSNLFIKGVFGGSAKFRYEGLIRIEKEAQKSHAYQKNQNLLLSPNCFIESKPYLEILANDVFCTHGSTTGKIDREQLFYAKSRGLSESSAEELLVAGFIEEIMLKIRQKVPSFKTDVRYQ